MLYLAIDQHSKQLTVNLRNEDGEVLLRRQVSTRGDAPRQFLTEVQQRSAAEGGYVAIVEVCGFNDWLLELLPACGCRETVLVQADRRSKRKTDRRDANKLGELLWVNRHRLAARQPISHLRRVRILTRQEREDRRLTQIRKNLGRELTRTINAIKTILRRENLEQHCPTKGIQTQAALGWLKKLVLSSFDRLEMNLLLARWKLLQEQKQQLEEELARRAAVHPDAQLVQTLPGAAAYAALGLASRVGPIERFPRPRSLANYWGLTPGCRNSGETTDRLGSITKEGSSLARFLLGQLVMHVLRKDAVMRAWYKRIKLRRGSKIARVAVMRRLATIIWHMLKKREPYRMGGPPRKKLKRHQPAGAGAGGSCLRGCWQRPGGGNPQDPQFPAPRPPPSSPPSDVCL
jgi:transposase